MDFVLEVFKAKDDEKSNLDGSHQLPAAPIEATDARHTGIDPDLRDYLPIPAGEIDEAPINIIEIDKTKEEILKDIAKRRGVSVEEVKASLPKIK
ncbi:MAG: hypothetical protein LKF36_04975 [Lactobacillus sp.]|jgi:hypothetical protein|nr:hypothetical protein [Lactobacillus sp.]